MQKILRLNSKWSFPHDQEVLLVLDGTTGLNMLPQAREFNQVNLSSNCTFDDDLEHSLIPSNHYLMVQRLKCSFYSIISPELGWFVPLIQVIGVTGFVLTKLDGTSRGGCVVGIFSN
jgi:hypothetical protein